EIAGRSAFPLVVNCVTCRSASDETAVDDSLDGFGLRRLSTNTTAAAARANTIAAAASARECFRTRATATCASDDGSGTAAGADRSHAARGTATWLAGEGDASSPESSDALRSWRSFRRSLAL